MSDPASMKDVGIQAALKDSRSSSEKYQDLVVGSRDFFRLIHFEFVTLVCAYVPGALGLLLRKFLYPTLLGSCGRGVCRPGSPRVSWFSSQDSPSSPWWHSVVRWAR